MAWDSSKGFWANVGGGIADNTVEKIPGWDSSKGFWANVGGGTWDNIKKYWYIPIIIGGVFIGYKVLTAGQMNRLLAALAAKK